MTLYQANYWNDENLPHQAICAMSWIPGRNKYLLRKILYSPATMGHWQVARDIWDPANSTPPDPHPGFLSLDFWQGIRTPSPLSQIFPYFLDIQLCAKSLTTWNLLNNIYGFHPDTLDYMFHVANWFSSRLSFSLVTDGQTEGRMDRKRFIPAHCA